MSVEQIPEHQWPSGSWVWLMNVDVLIDVLAETLPFVVNDLDDDGLGPERGCLLRLESGRVILLNQLEHAVRHYGAKGPMVQVDAADAVEQGLLPFAEEVRTALGLLPDQIGFVTDNPERWLIEAREAVQSGASWLARHGPQT